MAKLTPEEFAEKWASNLRASAEYMRRGVESVTEAPTHKAASKRQKWVARMTDKATQDKWERGLRAVSLEDWKTAMREKGISRAQAGAQSATPKMAQVGSKLLAHIDQGLAKLQGMPDVTLEDSRNRLLAWFDHMSKLRIK